MNNTKLFVLRRRLDRIDRGIVTLLEKRLNIAGSIADEKNKAGLPITDQSRERSIVQKLSLQTDNLLLRNSLEDLFNLIFQLSKNSRLLGKEKTTQFSKIGIIGTGLIGGSIIKALKIKNKKIEISVLKYGNQGKINKIFADNNVQSINQLIVHCDLIILASPINTVIPLARQISQSSNNLTDQLTVIDCASVKKDISSEFAKLTSDKIQFIATHPMAGSEKSGFKNSNAALFIDQPWIITPHEKNSPGVIENISQFIRFIGGNPVETPAGLHDKQVALVSHLAFLLSVLYFDFVVKKDINAVSIAGTGFKSMTRRAAGNPVMHSQIIRHNTKNIEQELHDFADFMMKFPIEDKSLLSVFQKIKERKDIL